MVDATLVERIEHELTTNDVVLYMMGTPVFPQCGFSAQAVQILNMLGVAFKGIDVTVDPGLRQGIKDYTNWPTLPQLYIKGEFIGGCDIMREMYQAGELQKILADKSILFNAGHKIAG
ncbi:MAG: Grx4 family monothiol glutaredoxin [Bdellovibrionales bacterium]